MLTYMINDNCLLYNGTIIAARPFNVDRLPETMAGEWSLVDINDDAEISVSRKDKPRVKGVITDKHIDGFPLWLTRIDRETLWATGERTLTILGDPE